MARSLLLILSVFTLSSLSLARREVNHETGVRLGADVQVHRDEPSRVGNAFPFELYAGYLIVLEGRIGTLSKLKFVLDTGVVHSVVNRTIADKLRLLRRPAQVFNFDKTVAIEAAAVPDVQFGPVQVRNISMLVADLGHFSDFASNVDVLIGLDLLRLRSLTIDYDAMSVLFGSLDRVVSRVSTNTDSVCMTVEVQVQNHPVRLIVDTGLQGVLLYEERLLKRIPELRVEGKTEGNIGARMRTKQGTLPRVRLGPEEIDLKVWLVKGPPDNVLSDIDGFLGTASLRARWINFNFAANTLSWK